MKHTREKMENLRRIIKDSEKLIDIMEAYSRGEDIEYFSKKTNRWLKCVGEPVWWKDVNYRIAPKYSEERKEIIDRLERYLERGENKK